MTSDRPDLDLIGIRTSPPWPDLPPPLRLVRCGARAAIYAPALRARTPREAARAGLDRARNFECAGGLDRILPVAPGATIPPDGVAAVLAAAEPAIAQAASETQGAVEFHLRVQWAEDRVLSAFGDSPELRPVLSAQPVRAGDLAHAVSRLAARLAGGMDAELAATGAARVDQPRGPGMILHRALLVPVGATALLDAALARIDAIWTEGLTLRLIGPMPPVSFALFRAVPVDASRRLAAQALLGPVPAVGAAAVAMARRAALRRAGSAGTADAIRAAALDLSATAVPGTPVAWRLEREPAAAILPVPLRPVSVA